MITVKLPYPPSVNHYYRHVGPRTLISREGRLYRDRVCAILRADGVRPLDGCLILEVELYPPDARRRDLDNVQKCLWDALAHGQAYWDDVQIKDLHAYMREPLAPHGMAIVRIKRKQ